MITVTFCSRGETLAGFTVAGHSGYAAAGKDIVCAAVTSAALMTANTVTEVLDLPAKTVATDAMIRLQLKPEHAAQAQTELKGFLLHIRELAKEYPQNINCQIQKSTITFRRCNNNAEN